MHPFCSVSLLMSGPHCSETLSWVRCHLLPLWSDGEEEKQSSDKASGMDCNLHEEVPSHESKGAKSQAN